MTNKVIECVIIDDEVKSIEYLSELVAKIPEFKLIATFTNPLDALNILANKDILVFLDINMNEISGINFTKLISNRVIFTTAHKEYAADSYEYENTVDYLLKPIYFERFLKAINKLQNIYTQDELPPDLNYLTLKSSDQSLVIDYGSIDYVKATGHYSVIYCKEEEVMVPFNLAKIANMLPREMFIRIHKSYLVNGQKIADLNMNKVMLWGGVYLPLGKAYSHNLKTLEK